MRVLIGVFFVSSLTCMLACDLRSGTAKKEMERWETTPQPAVAPKPADPPIESADIVEVDTSLDGDTITLNVSGETKTAECAKLNPLFVNGDRNVVSVKGPCRQIMVNGDGNQVTADAAMDLVFNGSDNVIRYARFVNGKRPSVRDNRPGNIVEKVAAGSVPTNQARSANRK